MLICSPLKIFILTFLQVKRILENIEKGFGALGDNGSIGGELTIPAIKNPVNSSVHEMTNAVKSVRSTFSSKNSLALYP